MKKKITSVMSLGLVLLVLTSCAPIKHFSENPKYPETIDRYVITQGEKSVIFMGKDYQYIIPASQPLINILSGPYRNEIKPSLQYFRNFVVQKDGVTFSGSVGFQMILELPLTLQSLEKKQWMERNQSPCLEKRYVVCSYSISPKGFRTRINPTIGPSQEMELQMFEVEEEADRSYLNSTARIIADKISSILLAPLVMVAMILYYGFNL